MAESVNHFFEGVDLDTAEKLMKATRCRDMHNFRLIDVGGNAFEATNLPGNGYDTASQIGCSLTDGFVPLGSDTLNGITYILSRHTDGRCEVGTFPSPNYTAGTGFQRIYQPLQNWTDAQIPYLLLKGAYNPATDTGPFRTSLFEMACKRIRVQCREDYDGSVNIYFTDNNNPLRVVNSGFHQRTGIRNTRLYYQGSFPHVVNLFHETHLPPDADLKEVKTNGVLSCGNWFAHFRYVTDSFDSTSFNTEVGPIQISPSNEDKEAFRVHGGSPETVTNKSVVLTINTTSLDRSYKYVEIAMVRRFSDESLSSKIVNRLFDIEDMVAAGATFDIEITGRELTVDTTEAKVIKRKRTDDIVRDIAMIDLYLFAANTTERTWYDDRLKDFAATILAEADDSLVLKNNYPDDYFGGTDEVQDISIDDVLYKNYKHTYNYVGYFRSEPYQFGAMFLMKKTGILTPAFPVRGTDHINPGLLLDSTNPNGIVRFPKNHVSQYMSLKDAIIMGVKFTVDSANVNQWLRDNVAGIYFVRSERRPNMLYQGLIMQCFASYDPLLPIADCNGQYARDQGLGSQYGEPGRWERTRNNSSTQRCAPFLDTFFSGSAVPDSIANCPQMLRAKLPWISGFNDGVRGIVSGFGYRINPADWQAPSKHIPIPLEKHHGLISPDFCFSQKSYDVTAFLEMQGEWTNSFLTDSKNPIERYFWEHTDLFIPPVLFDLKTYASLHPVQQWQTPDNNGFVSYYNEGKGVEYDDTDSGSAVIAETIDPYHFFYHFSQARADRKRTIIKNMEMGIVSYLGINSKISEGGYVLGGYNPLDGTDHKLIYNLYLSDPDLRLDISDYYNFRSETFFKISKLIALPDAPDIDEHLCYRGDCFISRAYHKVLANPRYIPDQTHDNFDGETGAGDTTYGFGQTIGITLECSFNVAMRNSKGKVEEGKDTETFFPEYEVFEPKSFTTKLRSRESYDFNRGYNKVLSINPHAPFDATLPLQKKRFPNRIFYTDRHIVGSFADSWRRSGIAQHQDYDQRGGEIMAIMNNNDHLLVYCRNSIQLPSVNARALANTADGGTIVLGSQVEVLHPKTATQSEEFGLQNQFALIRGLHGLYSVDVARRKILFIDAANQLDVLSDSKFIRSGFDGFMELVSSFSDVMMEIGDAPVCSEGFSLGYNRKFGEIVFSLIHANVSRTIVFNELAKCFTWTVDYVSPFYFTNNSDFYSCNPINKRHFYLHDVEQIFGQSNYCRFYGDLYANARICRIQLVVNKVAEETKLFENIRVSSNPVPLYRVTYDTEGQQAVHFPFVGNADKYIEPEYEEDFWEFPIRRADTSKNAYYQPGSEMRGSFILITFEWKTAELVNLKSIVTFLKKSFH